MCVLPKNSTQLESVFFALFFKPKSSFGFVLPVIADPSLKLERLLYNVQLRFWKKKKRLNFPNISYRTNPLSWFWVSYIHFDSYEIHFHCFSLAWLYLVCYDV
ncbi:hypothetical protein DLM75_18795 [Leptospira stimsonii]|uniref:Uncharacterized protein n=1 Tax=Leptospira stimsonii TaxID=2202203 RepID=A0A396YZW7_9LEPT|nr:hypothetical protein DLM75_18795 [Leptospira stimsonii]